MQCRIEQTCDFPVDVGRRFFIKKIRYLFIVDALCYVPIQSHFIQDCCKIVFVPCKCHSSNSEL